jgi:hypothetical protein
MRTAFKHFMRVEICIRTTTTQAWHHKNRTQQGGDQSQIATTYFIDFKNSTPPCSCSLLSAVIHNSSTVISNLKLFTYIVYHVSYHHHHKILSSSYDTGIICNRHSRAVVLSYTSPARLGRSPLIMPCRTQEGGSTALECIPYGMIPAAYNVTMIQ